MNNETFEMVAKTLSGLEEILADELMALGGNDLQIGRRMVSFTGDKEMLYKANFYCRTALRILKPIYHFKAKDADTVYNNVKKVEWEKYMSLDTTFAIDSVIYSEDFNHSKFVAYRTKDAIVDYFMEKFEKRPSVRINNPDLYINIHISHNDCTLSIDSSGESLHKRGYRVDQTEAPLNEVLAAGMILKAGWKGDRYFIDPMCGSGTLLIEAAMIALNIAPGIHRKEFAFEKWVDFDKELFDRIYNDDSREKEFTFKCIGSDISPAAIEIAQKNVRSAGLSKCIELNVLPFQQYNEAPKPGLLVTNPPYGERLSSNDLLNLYTMIGERLKHVFVGYDAWIISYKEECFEKIGLRPSEKVKLINGSLECEYRKYQMFDGTNRDYKTALNNEQKEYDEDGRSPQRKYEKRPNFKTDRMDTPARRFAAAHKEGEEEDDYISVIPAGKRFINEKREERPFRKKVVGDHKYFGDKPGKLRFKNDDGGFGKKDFKDRKRDDHRPSFGKPFKRRKDNDSPED